MRSPALIFLLCLPLFLLSQRMNYREVALAENIRKSELNLIYTDKQGFIWLAGETSLFRYDGLNFLEIKTDSVAAKDRIASIFQDRAGMMWIGWKSGRISIVGKDRKFRAYYPEEGVPSVEIVGWAEDAAGRLWMATYGEGVYVRSSEGRWYNFSRGDGLPALEIYSITDFEEGVVVATDQGLVKCGFSATSGKSLKVYNKENGLSDQIVKSVFCDSTGLWLAFYESAIDHIQKDGSIVSQSAPPHNDARQILKSGNNLWWLSGNGLLHLKSPAGNWNEIEISPAATLRVKQITTDLEGHLWILTNRGVFILDQWIEKFRTEAPVTAVAKKSDKLWFSQGTGLYKVNFTTGEREQVWNGEHMILSLFADDYDRVWAGTFDGGVVVWDDRTGSIKRYTENNGLANNNVLAIDGTREEVWLGTLGGASRFTFSGTAITGPESFSRKDGLENQYIYTVHITAGGQVLLGTDGQGVMRWTGKRFEPLTDSIPSEVVLDLSSDRNGTVWWITQEGRLHFFEKGKVKEIGTIDKEMGHATGVVADDNGVLVFYETGIGLWHPSNESWTGYDEAFGLKNYQPELHAQYLASDNYLYTGTANGIAVLQLQFLRQQSQPLTYLEDVELYFSPTDQQQFDARENHLTFRYVGRWYNDPSAVRYKIKLKGYDLEWVISKDDEITYPRLAPGKYEFMVVAGINGQFPEDQMKSFVFRIRSPWYSRWYVWLPFILILGFLGYVVFRYRENQVQRRQLQEKDRVRAQYEALKSQVNPHFLFNSFNTLMALIDESKDEAQEYLSDLSDFFRNILQFREVDLISLEEELQIVQTYLQLQARRYNPNLLVEIDVESNAMETQIPPLTLQLLAENALKHNVISRLKPLNIRIFTKEGHLVVRNNLQSKLRAEPSMGYGLHSIRKKYAFHTDREVRILQDTDYFEVQLPLLNLK